MRGLLSGGGKEENNGGFYTTYTLIGDKENFYKETCDNSYITNSSIDECENDFAEKIDKGK